MGLFSKDKPMDQKLKLAMKTLGKADQPLLGALSEIDQGEPYEALPRALKLRWGKHSEKESSDVESHENPGARMDPRRSESA